LRRMPELTRQHVERRKRSDDLEWALTDRDFNFALGREALEVLHPEEPSVEKGDLETFEYACALVLRAKLQDAKLLVAELMGEPISPSHPNFAGMRTRGAPPLPGEERKRSSVIIHRAETDDGAITYEELFRR
jgi:hypothetical protein